MIISMADYLIRIWGINVAFKKVSQSTCA